MQSVTITEAARRLGVSTKTVRRRIADGSLAAHKASGPGGFVYRVTDPSVLVVTPGVDTPAPRVDRGDRADARGWSQLVQTLVMRATEAEVRAARAEWERDRLLAEIEQLRRPALPAPAPRARPWWRRWWSPAVIFVTWLRDDCYVEW